MNTLTLNTLFTECQLDLQTDIPINHQPIFVNKNYQLVIPDLNNKSAHGILSLAKDQELTLACPGHGNSLTEFSTSVVKGNCRDNGQIEASGETLSEGNLSCKKAPQSYIQMTNNRCGKPGEPNSVFFNVGFLVRKITCTSTRIQTNTSKIIKK